MNTSRVFIGLATIFILLAFASYKYGETKEIRFNETIILNDAKNAFEKDVMFRKWIAMHGGVYVPITEKTTPNRYLKDIPYRDINTTDGMQLTLMNPAYALRQFMDEFKGSYGEKGKITGLKLINPNNAPDKFEKKALLRFQDTNSSKEYYEKIVESSGKENFRYIKALTIEKSCLKCHAKQGYKIGESKGAISITIPLERYDNFLDKSLSYLKMIHILTLLFGILFLYLTYLYLKKSQHKEDKLSRQVNEVYSIFNSGNIVLFRWNNDEHWSIDYVSQNVFGLLGYTKDEFMSGKIAYASLIDSRDIAQVTQEVTDASRDKIVNFAHKPYRVKTKSGDTLWVNDSSQILRDKDGNIEYYVGYIQNATQMKQYELDIQNEKERFQLAIDGSNDGLWDWNPQTNEIWYSPRWKSMLGCSDDELENTLDEWIKRIHPDDIEDTFDAIQNHIDGKTEVYESEYRLKGKNGKWVWILDRGKVLTDSGGIAQRFVGFHTDITHKKNQEEILQLKIKEALEENTRQLQTLQQQSKMASMGEMIGAIAHQWRQPLNELGLSIQNLKYDYRAGVVDKDFIDEFIEYNKKTIMFMSNTIDDFRSFFRVDKEKKRFNVLETTQSVVSMLSAQLNSLNITTNIEGDSFDHIGYQSEYQQVILNIVNNAKDALVDNNIKNPTINISITRCSNPNIDKQTCQVTISDNAGGVAEDIIDRIFEPYFTTKEQGRGTGIGLYMSKMIIEENMGGKLTVENRDGGASFTIIFKDKI
ncbi:PUTATIVE TWO-COMPONENT SENSOR [hydrothermal vent metagenome]|uniref:histidine kinase n=1 Tax=hydrothermal vent metagenome TaxID=652676 RepID=A0A1W1C273_9ZZZZ